MKSIKPLLLSDRLRAKTLDRFHVVDMANPGNVAEHSFGVQVIAEHLLVNIYEAKNSPLIDPIPMGGIIDTGPSIEERYFLMKYAQVHDLPELAASDISTPTKMYIRANEKSVDALMDILDGELMGDISDAAMDTIRDALTKHMMTFDDIMDKIEHECLPELADIMTYFKMRPHLKVVAKAADILEAMSLFKTGRGRDEIQNERIEKKLNLALESLVAKASDDMPEFNWGCVLLTRETLMKGDSSINEFEATF